MMTSASCRCIWEAEMGERFTIYCHTNRVNGKRYVGQTKATMQQRWSSHKSSALAANGRRDCRYFHAAIRKHGPERFSHRVLIEVRSRRKANDAERLWIRRLNCLTPKGYNIEAGGRACSRSEITRRKIRETKARMSPFRRAIMIAKMRASKQAVPPAVRSAIAFEREARWRKRKGDPLVRKISLLLKGPVRPARLTVHAIAKALRMNIDRGTEVRVGSALRRLGYNQVRVRYSGTRLHVYERRGEPAPRILQDIAWCQKKTAKAWATKRARGWVSPLKGVPSKYWSKT